MIKTEDALKIVLRGINILDPEVVRLTNSLERVLAEDIYSSSDIPGFDNSAMDGYAVRSSDTANASKNRPKVLEVTDSLKAGDTPKKTLRGNEAIRIMTGAVMPQGADSVVMVEETQWEEKDKVKILKEVKFDENVRKKGEDIKRGEVIIEKGTLITSAHIGILASLGISKIKVTRKPKVAILATGDELIDVDKALAPGKLRSSNTYTLYSQIIECGGTPKDLGIARDEPDMLETKIKEGLSCDLIITSGGVSVGDYDLVKLVLAKMGTNIRFWQVAMRPGKPLVFGMIKGIPIFGLPGNPVSSMVSFEVFVRPAILRMRGQKVGDRKEADAVIEEGLKKKKGVRYFLRAQTRWEDGAYFTKTTGPQGSGILRSMALADSLIVLPEEQERVEKGARVRVRFLR